MPGDVRDLLRQQAYDRMMRERMRRERGAVKSKRGRKNRWDAVNKWPDSMPDEIKKKRGHRA